MLEKGQAILCDCGNLIPGEGNKMFADVQCPRCRANINITPVRMREVEIESTSPTNDEIFTGESSDEMPAASPTSQPVQKPSQTVTRWLLTFLGGMGGYIAGQGLHAMSVSIPVGPGTKLFYYILTPFYYLGAFGSGLVMCFFVAWGANSFSYMLDMHPDGLDRGDYAGDWSEIVEAREKEGKDIEEESTRGDFLVNREPLSLHPQIDCIPSIHGRAVFAQEVRRAFLSTRYDCIAVELPVSLRQAVIEGVELLPMVSAIVYREPGGQECYVPVTPSDSLMEAIRMARSERIPLEFIDLETPTFRQEKFQLPDEYAVKISGIQAYCKRVLPLPTTAPNSQQDSREKYMANRLLELTQFYNKILFICGLGHFPAMGKHLAAKKIEAPTSPRSPKTNYHIYTVHPDTLYLVTGELPYLTYLYEKMRGQIDLAEFDKTDSIKEILLEARANHLAEFPEESHGLAPAAMQTILTYVRNLSLLHGQITPSLYHLIVAAKGVGGGTFALAVAEVAKYYPFIDLDSGNPTAQFFVEDGANEEFREIADQKAYLPGRGDVDLKNRLPGPPIYLKNINIDRKPPKQKKEKWKRQFNPYGQCSWPDEDVVIENFVAHIRKRARGVAGEDQKKVEKFTTSTKDGIDIRETLRNWHTGEIYVKEIPPAKGEVGAVVMVFDEDEGNDYPWCSTWLAEHENESTLAFYATDFQDDMVGPNIGRSFYGGAMFIFPPLYLPDIWTDSQFRKWPNKIEKLTAAAIQYSREKYVAYVAEQPPSTKMRKLAKNVGRHLIYLPLTTFSAATIRKLRKFHVLGGKQVRSYARDYIR